MYVIMHVCKRCSSTRSRGRSGSETEHFLSSEPVAVSVDSGVNQLKVDYILYITYKMSAKTRRVSGNTRRAFGLGHCQRFRCLVRTEPCLSSLRWDWDRGFRGSSSCATKALPWPSLSVRAARRLLSRWHWAIQVVFFFITLNFFLSPESWYMHLLVDSVG